MDSKFSLFHHAAIIAPRSRHDDFLALKNQDPHLDFELYTLEEMEDLFAYQYDERALEEVYKEVGDEEQAEAILVALSRLRNEKEYASPKLEVLKPLQQRLLAEGLLYAIPNPERSFEHHNVVISGYQNTLRISNVLGELHNMAICYDTEEIPAKPLRIYFEFADIYDELRDVFNRIAADLASGTSIDDIYLLGADESYQDLLERFSLYYGCQVETTASAKLYDSALYHSFRADYLEKGPAILSDFLAKHPGDKNAEALYKLFARFSDLPHDEKTLKSFFDERLKHEAQDAPHYEHVVRQLHDYIPPKNAHVYAINCSMGVFPPVAPEGDYLSDSESASLGLPTSEDLTQEWAAEVNALFDSSALVYVSYKKKAFGGLFFPSGILEEKGFKAELSPILPYEYAQDGAKLFEASLRDDEVNYLRVDKRLKALKNRKLLLDYRNFDYTYHPFVSVNPDEPRSYSPTQLKKYYGCPYSYYLERILDIEENAPNFSARIGTIFHAVMQSLYEVSPFDFETAWDKAVAEESEKNGAFTPKENALFFRLKDECSYVVAFYQNHDSLLFDPRYSTEKPFHLVSEDNPLVSFSGQYDKIVEFGKEHRYYIIVDYKTGGERFSEEMLPYGLSMQLPYYAYYASQEKDLQGAELIGLFIGPVLSPTLVKKVKDSLEKFNSDKFRIEGVFAKDISKLLVLDPSAYKSTLIKGLAYSEKKGFYPYSLKRAKSPEDFAALAKSAKDLTLGADQKIRSGDFTIAPVKFKAIFDACAYCTFRDVCYRKDEAIRYLPDGKVEVDEDETSADEEEESDGLE